MINNWVWKVDERYFLSLTTYYVQVICPHAVFVDYLVIFISSGKNQYVEAFVVCINWKTVQGEEIGIK